MFRLQEKKLLYVSTHYSFSLLPSHCSTTFQISPDVSPIRTRRLRLNHYKLQRQDLQRDSPSSIKVLCFLVDQNAPSHFFSTSANSKTILHCHGASCSIEIFISTTKSTCQFFEAFNLFYSFFHLS